ncbi:putative ammonium transporter 3 [Hydractinia symbiolongicarpus]|uniref:putative ammonium transporter 3 n=1 Tax=Hydractinia symbiolongicarpus TaxID=13093 RepID=UPI00254F427B|nr:putative ammonium transporter 3 [Hydractinia symbiolongicarpus]
MANMSNPFGGKVDEEGTDALWIIISSFIIFTMQSGFGLFESGMVSRRSEANVIVKNMLDVTLGGLAYWFIGFGFSFGPNTKDSAKMSGEGYFLTDVDLNNEAHVYTQYFFQLSFATTATTIVSGAVAERIHLTSYIIFAIINTGLIYVFPAHWMWSSDGWLATNGAYDFAGSSVVHMSGGAAALVAAIILGPRRGRFDQSEEKRSFGMASPTNVVLGTFFLWWGWIGFNCGSTFAVTGGLWKVASRVAVVTMNGAIAGGFSAVLLCISLYCKRHYVLDIPQFVSGVLGGLVAITACASVISPWESIVIGFIGGIIANGVIALLNALKVDDPVGCFGVHWASGLWSMICVGLFAKKTSPFDLVIEDGLFKGGSGKLLAYNIAGAMAISVWSGGLTAIVFFILKYTIGIRMSYEQELLGSDQVEHNIVEDIIPNEGNHVLGKHVAAADIKYRGSRTKKGDTNDNIEIKMENAAV